MNNNQDLHALSPRHPTQAVLPQKAWAALAATQTENGQEQNAHRNQNGFRKISDDYEKRAHALSDSHFGKAK